MIGYRRELELALDLARRAGALALAYRARGPAALELREKSPHDGPVTRADTEIDRLIVEALGRVFPDDTVVAEESRPAGLGTGPRCWHIDPIDGTQEFAAGDDCWAVHIGLSQHGQPVLGVVYEPARLRISWGVIDAQSKLARMQVGEEPPQSLQPSSRPLAQLRMVSSRSHHAPRIEEVRLALGIDEHRAYRLGSVGVKMNTIARGDADVYVHPATGTKSWDTCAPEAILAAAGGEVTDLRGERLRYGGAGTGNDEGVLASHGPLHAAIVERISPLLAHWD